jgi:plasmid maintenance system killer protein
MLDYAQQLGDLRSPPGNRLEALKDDRKGWSAFTPIGIASSA